MDLYSNTHGVGSAHSTESPRRNLTAVCARLARLMRSQWRTYGVLFICWLSCNLGAAQETTARKVFRPSVTTYAEYQTWNRSTEGRPNTRIAQLAVPILLKYPLTGNIAADLLSTTIVSSVEGESLNGFRDVKARLVGMFAEDRVLLSFGLNLPTGRSSLNDKESNISYLLSDPVFGFRYVNLGEGLDVSANCAVAQSLGPFTVGAGVGYLRKGKYTLFESSDGAYEPGDETTVHAGVEFPMKPLRLRVTTHYVTYGSDKNNGRDIYQERDRLSLETSASWYAYTFQTLLRAYYLRRGVFRQAEGNLGGGGQHAHNDLVTVALELGFPLSRTSWLIGIAQYSSIGANTRDGLSALHILGAGMEMAYQLTRLSRLSLGILYQTGADDGGIVSVTGIRANGTLNVFF